MKIHLIITALLISVAVSSHAQSAHIEITVSDAPNGNIIYQRLDKYSIIDSVSLDGGGRACLDVECLDDYQFFRLIAFGRKLPMILRAGDSIGVSINTGDIYRSEISGSAETEYLINGLRKKNRKDLCKMIRKNPDMMANVMLVWKLDFGKNLSIIKSVAERFSDRQLAIIEELTNKIQSAERLRKGEPAPEFTITRSDGSTASTAEYAGGEYTIFFWAQWCRPSALAARRYQMIKPDRRILPVELDEGVNYFDNDAARIYDVTELPLAIEIDKKGRISKILKPGSKYQTED